MSKATPKRYTVAKILKSKKMTFREVLRRDMIPLEDRAVGQHRVRIVFLVNDQLENSKLKVVALIGA